MKQPRLRAVLESLFWLSTCAGGWWFAAAVCFDSTAAVAADVAAAVENRALTARLRLERVVPASDLDLVDINGVQQSLADEASRATVVVFMSFGCPISNRYAPVLVDLAERFKDRGVAFRAVVCDAAKIEDVRRDAGEFRIRFPVFYDPRKLMAAQFLATTTPQAFLLDGNRAVRYFGAIDDLYQDRATRLPEVKHHHLVEAIEQLLAGQQVSVKETVAIGCPLEREERPLVATGKKTFYRDVMPILQSKCQDCHQPDEVGPFSLLTFEDAVRWSDLIKEVVGTRRMPPWPLTGGLPMSNDISLTNSEIATLTEWVDEGCPKGDASEALNRPTPPKSQADFDKLDPPDIVVRIPGPFHLAAKGGDRYQNFVVDLGNKEDLYVWKTEFIPGDKALVHHALIFYDATGLLMDAQRRLGKPEAVGTGDEDYGFGYDGGMGLGFIPNPALSKKPLTQNVGGGLGGWVAGVRPQTDWPSNATYLVPADSSVHMNIHYHRTGKPEVDRDSRIGLWLRKEKPEKFMRGYIVDTSFRMIPKGVERFVTTGSKTIPNDCTLWFMAPHMHSLGKEFRIWHQDKDSEKRTLLLELKNWDFNWQQRYRLKEHYPLRKGDSLHAEAILDNSAKNPNNLFTPPRDIFLGEQSEDEMAFAPFGVIQDSPPDGTLDIVNYYKKLIEAQAWRALTTGSTPP